MQRPPAGSEPILCAPLLRKVDAKLVELLRALTPPEWNLPTIAPRWRVRDVAAHLLDTCLRKLSMVRDGCLVEAIALVTPQDVVDLVNRLNQEGVTVYRRLSPAVLIDLMERVCAESAAFHEALDPFAPAAFNVSWAGEDTSLNWFDTARELTERWHHQQQIRMATDKPGILTPELYYPVLDCFLRGLPFALRSTEARIGSRLVVEIAGQCGGVWVLARGAAGWRFSEAAPGEPAARATIPQEIAWRVFTKGIRPDAALAEIRIEGDHALGAQILGLTAIVG